MILDRILTGLVYLMAFYLLFFIGKWVHDVLNRRYRITHELVENDNPAVAIALVGYYAGLAICIGGAIAGPSLGIADDLIDLAIYGSLGIVLLNLSVMICDRLILNQFNVDDELIQDRNAGTGAVRLGVCMASGLVLYGAISGEGGTVWTAIVFWAIGQALLVAASRLYNLITSYSIHDEIEKDNVAAGTSFAGALIGFGLVVGLAAEGDFHSWGSDLPGYVALALVGLVMLPMIRWLTDKLLLPTVHLADEILGVDRHQQPTEHGPNLGAAFIEAFSYISAGWVIYWCV